MTGFRCSVRSITFVAVSALVLSQGTLAAAEEEPALPALRGWEPSFTLGFGVHSQELAGDVVTDFASTGQLRGTPLRFSYAEARLSLSTPTLGSNFLRPRVFFHGGADFPFTREQRAANSLQTFNFAATRPAAENAAYQANCPAAPPLPGGPGNAPTAFGTSLCEIQTENEIVVNGSLFAGIGLDLTLPLGGYQFHLKPSVNYFLQSYRAKGRVIRTTNANQTFTATPASGGDDPATAFRERYELVYQQSETLSARNANEWASGVGPQLEMNVEVARVGSAVFELFVQSSLYWMLDNRSVEFRSSGLTGGGSCTQDSPNGTNPTGMFVPPNFCSAPTAGGAPLSGTFSTRIGPTIFRGGGGVRVTWRGARL